ncbi:protein FATTY ACID EXPORT 3, chloroplastic-like [Nymphaea colorata]|nr:protein FATTY ACID EXPORT 3, chloroplastic-like [Nymphaea colorata]
MTAVSEFLVSQGNPGLTARGTGPALPRASGGPLLLAFPGAGSFLKRKGVGEYRRLCLVNPTRRLTLFHGRVIPPATASREGSEHSDVDVEKVKSEIEKQAEETKEVWIKTIESLKSYAINMQNMSQEAYELYSQQAVVILKQMSEQLKGQAEKARQDMAILAEGVSTEGKQYLSTAAENSPEPVKDIVETFASQAPELREISEVRDFFIGIPYGALLSVGGFLSFMLTGSIPSIRFGMVLGGALLSLSILSLRAWKEGKSSPLFLKGQTGIAAILFVRELLLFCQRPCIWTAAVALISGSVLAFYAYRIKVESHTEGGESKKLV